MTPLAGENSRPSQSPFVPSGFFVLRSALLPFDVLDHWCAGLTPGLESLDGAALDAALSRDRRVLCARLRTLVADPVVRESLYLASPSTCVHLDEWLNDADAENPKLERTLTRYLQRMAGRATPFGLFAGCSVGQIGEATTLRLAPPVQHRRSTRLDNHYLFSLTEHLARDEHVRRVKRYRTNSSLYKSGGRWRYVRATASLRSREHQLVAVESDAYMDGCLGLAEHGATVADFVAWLVAADPDGEINASDALAYVNELIDRQIVVCDLSPLVTGTEPLDDLIESLADVTPCRPLVDALRDVQQKLEAIDVQPLGLPAVPYTEIADALQPLGVPVDAAKLFQTDLVMSAPDATIGRETLDAIASAIDVLQRLTSRNEYVALKDFRAAFRERYEQQEVPLVDALDEESGIAFERSSAPTAEFAPLLEGLPLHNQPGQMTQAWTPRDAYLLRRLLDVTAAGETAMDLSADDVRALATAEPGELPDAFAVFATVFGEGHEPGQSPRVLIRNVQGPSGAALLGRFCHADPALLSALRAHLAREEAFQPDVVFAEIVHLPHGRLGNILARPLLRDYEIAYLGRSGAPLERQISIRDLMVSVEDDTVVLRSTRLGRRVIPRMTNAHAYNQGQSVYRFLCALQTQGASSLMWNWGALGAAPFLPRVTVGTAVLARASWHLSRAECAALGAGSVAQRWTAVQRWRTTHRLPRFVALTEADNELPVDFENPLSVETMLGLLGRSSAVLYEMLPAADRLAARGPNGGHVTEIVVPFVRTAASPVLVDRRGPRARPTVRRAFAPGSDWVYLKVYAGTATVDTLLRSVMADAIHRLRADGAVDRWFFVRYGDPEWHLRLRLHVAPGRASQCVRDVAEAAADAAHQSGLVARVQVDTYEREVERYGGDPGMLPSEDVFWRDSEAALDILQGLEGEEMGARWRICLKSWDLLLSDMGFALDARQRFVQESCEENLRPYRAAKTVKLLQVRLGEKFRQERKALETFFAPDGGDMPPAVLAALKTRSERLAPVMLELHRRSAATPGLSVAALARSYLHMTANRLLRSSHRPQEMVLYDFLARLYRSQLARLRGEHEGRRQ